MYKVVHYLYPVCKLEFVRCGPVEKKQIVTSLKARGLNFWILALLPSSAKPQQQPQLPAAAKLAEL